MAGDGAAARHGRAGIAVGRDEDPPQAPGALRRQHDALGVDDSTAFAIAFTHRLCTYYLPPIWGYSSRRWLRRKGFV
jgi:hypothetical protein